MKQAEYIKTLRDFANWLEARPELGAPTTGITFRWCGQIGDGDDDVSVDSKEGLVKFATSARPSLDCVHHLGCGA